MARIGKIARLPRDIRTQLNSRLQDGAEGKILVEWLNSLPQVKETLAQFFDNRPITEQNLSDWRQGGYQDWLVHEEVRHHADDLTASRHDLQTVAQSPSVADHLANAIGFRMAAIFATQGSQLDEPALNQLRALCLHCQAVVNLRRSEQNQAHLKIENERWDRLRQQMDDDRAQALEQRQRDKLAAPILVGIKNAKLAASLGGGPATVLGTTILTEMETCKDPAHFESKTLAKLSHLTPEQLDEELAQTRFTPPDPLKAAMKMFDEIDAYEERKHENDYPSLKDLPGFKPHRQPRKRARHHPRRPTPTAAPQPPLGVQPLGCPGSNSSPFGVQPCARERTSPPRKNPSSGCLGSDSQVVPPPICPAPPVIQPSSDPTPPQESNPNRVSSC